MKVITPGHVYEVVNFDISQGLSHQVIQFVQKEPWGPEDTLQTVANGTTNEELLNVLIDRLDFLIAKVPSRESSIAKTKLEEALMWLLKRTANRISRGVEGTRSL